MKRGIATAVLCATVVAATLMPATAEAAGMSVGASTWYSKMSIKSPGTDTLYSEWSLMYGPSIGIDFAKDWSVSSVFLTGNYRFEEDLPIVVNYRRYDSDTTLNYSVLKWLKVFGGLKYMRYDSRDSSSVIPLFGSAQTRHYTYGPGLGLGLTVPLRESLFALATVSAMRLAGKSSNDNYPDLRCVETGYNVAASLAYYIDSMATTLSLGGRYQYFKSVDRNIDYSRSDLTFYGITFAAVYSFSLGAEE